VLLLRARHIAYGYYSGVRLCAPRPRSAPAPQAYLSAMNAAQVPLLPRSGISRWMPLPGCGSAARHSVTGTKACDPSAVMRAWPPCPLCDPASCATRPRTSRLHGFGSSAVCGSGAKHGRAITALACSTHPCGPLLALLSARRRAPAGLLRLLGAGSRSAPAALRACQRSFWGRVAWGVLAMQEDADDAAPSSRAHA